MKEKIYIKKGKRTNFNEKIYVVLKNRIIRFELKPGEKIRERELALELGVSRTPIREAIKKLEQEGFIIAYPNNGYYVSNITRQEVEELFKLREILEPFAIREAVKKGSLKEWARLEQIFLNSGKGKNLRETENPRLQTDKQFRVHEEIARLSGNLTLELMLKTIYDKIDRVRWVDMFFHNQPKESLKTHFQIIKYLKNGDAKKAVAVHLKHLKNLKKATLHLLDKKMNFFYIS